MQTNVSGVAHALEVSATAATYLLSRVTYRVNPRDGLVHTVLLSGELEAMLLLPHVRLRRQSQTPELWMMGRLED